MRFFNTAGPVNPEDHYCLPPLQRFDLDELLRLIEQKKYFVLHAPRQTGKTSGLLALQNYLNAQGNYRCAYVNVETGQAAREQVHEALQTILGDLAFWSKTILGDSFVDEIWIDVLKRRGAYGALGEVLARWAAADSRPLIVFIDEIDSLIGDTLISVLRQLRAGYTQRPKHFPQSVVLCGVRDVRDYRIHSSREKAAITGGSAFNIKAKSLRLGNFTQADIETLYKQHTEATGQVFASQVITQVWELTQGQPWLVNALAQEVCFDLVEGKDRKQPITMAMIEQAKENIILRRETHLDQLMDKLEEPRVQRVIEPLLSAEALAENIAKDDIAYVVDLGLVEQSIGGGVRIANPIYQEVIPRELGWNIQSGMSEQTQWYVQADGRLDMAKLLTAFQEFFREHSEHWVERFQYKEAGPQLLLQAFLQRIVNGGGRIEREYGLGRMRTDLLILWPYPDNNMQRIVLELKILHKTLERTLEIGLEQTWQYLDRCGAEEGHLIVFDRTPNKSWEDKLFQHSETVHGKAIQIWGM